MLFLWATSPILREALRVVEAWGFAYKASFVWDKVRPMIGHYNMVAHELLLICTRGACRPDTNDALVNSVQQFEKTEHSRKPERFREIIDALYPHGNRIELFGHGAARPGWQVWGNEAQNGQQADLRSANLPTLPPPPSAVLPLPPPPISRPAVAQTFLGEP